VKVLIDVEQMFDVVRAMKDMIDCWFDQFGR
jgi:hypothetical protein